MPPAPAVVPVARAVPLPAEVLGLTQVALDAAEYERVIAKMGSLLPYRRARTLLSEFLPLDDLPAVETTRRRTMRVGARLEQQAVASQTLAPAAAAQAIALSIDGGHVRSVR